MSRTYRLRSLPVVSNQHRTAPKKIGDGQYAKRRRAKWDWYRGEGSNYTLLRHAYNADQRASPDPVGAIWDHPWVRYGVARNRMKKYYRVSGNRRIRRNLKNLLARWAKEGDDYETYLPRRNDGWDKRDLW